MNEKTYFKKKQLEQGRTFSLVGKWSRLHINSWTRQCLPLYIYIYRYIYATPPIVFRSLLFFSYLWGESFLFFFGGGGWECGTELGTGRAGGGERIAVAGDGEGKKTSETRCMDALFPSTILIIGNRIGIPRTLNVTAYIGSQPRYSSDFVLMLCSNFFFRHINTKVNKLTTAHTKNWNPFFFSREHKKWKKKKKKPGDHLFRIASVPFWKKKHTHTQISHKNKEMRQKWEFGRGVKRKAKKPIAKPPPPQTLRKPSNASHHYRAKFPNNLVHECKTSTVKLFCERSRIPCFKSIFLFKKKQEFCF